MSDYIIRAVSSDGYVRGFGALTTDLVQELQTRHHLTPVVSAALGRTATMGAIMSTLLKEKHHQVSIQVVGDGPVGKISVDADGQGRVRGTVDHPVVDLPLNQKGKLDVAKAVGKGKIYIFRDLGLKEPYQGVSPIISGELAEDFTYYFASSEQIPSSVGLGVFVKGEQIISAGGYLLQILPGAPEDLIDQLEQNIQSLPSITDQLNQGTTPEQLLEKLMGQEVQFLTRQSITFSCRCSKERVENMLISLGKKEIETIRKKLGQAEVRCHYCHETYLFHDEDLQEVLKKFD